MESDWVPDGLDIDRPSVARVYDYLLEPVEGLDCWGMVAVTTMDLEIVGVSG
jgi:hypothetical protein